MNQGQGNSNSNSNSNNSNNKNQEHERGRNERPTKRRRINALLGKTPVTLGNTNLLQHYEAAAPFIQFSEFCKPYGDAFVFAQVPNEAALNVTQFPTDYSTSAAECLVKPGFHAWVVFEGGTFAAARVFSVYEILSKHMDLYLRAGRLPVVAAGEVTVVKSVTGYDVLYNFQSGTFMQDIAKRFGKKYTHVRYEDFYGSWMDELWREAGASSVNHAENTIISPVTIPLTEDVLRAYSQGGVEFRSFPTLAECQQYANYSSDIAKAKRNTIKRRYDSVVDYMQKYGKPITSFENWLKEQKQEKLFQEPVSVTPMFRGGRTRRFRRSK